MQNLATEITSLGIDKTSDLDALILERDASDKDTEGFYALFHSIGFLSAIIAVEEMGKSADPRQFTGILQSRFAEIMEGFGDALERYAEPEIFGLP